MIDSDEIEVQAEELGVNIANVERDYVFGWLLAGLFHTDNELRSRLILKGGKGFARRTSATHDSQRTSTSR